MRFAIPSSYGTFTHYFPPVLTGAPRENPMASSGVILAKTIFQEVTLSESTKLLRPRVAA
jgi:hypothetical protein